MNGVATSLHHRQPPLRPILGLLFVACAVPESPGTAGRSEEPIRGSTVPISPIPSVDGASFEVIEVRVGGAGSAEPSQDASVALSWEGERLVRAVPVRASLDAGTLVIGGDVLDPRVGEGRHRGVVLELPASAVTTGAVVGGTLSWFETPEDSEWLDVLLQAPVEVEVLGGSGVAGELVSVRVLEAAFAPGLGVGVAIAGELYEGPFQVDFEVEPVLDCGPLSPDQLGFVASPPQDLGATGYLGTTRGTQTSDPMKPFAATGAAIDALTNFDGTRSLQRVPGSGGLLTVAFEGGSIYGMDVREGPGIFEVQRTLTVDATSWGPGFGLTLTRAYSDAADGVPTCTATFSGGLTPL